MKSIGVEAGEWIAAVERVGLGTVVVIILALCVGFGLAIRGPEWIRALNQTLEIVLAYWKARKQVPRTVRKKAGELSVEISERKRKIGGRKTGPKR